MSALIGDELVFVIGVSGNGQLAATTEPITTQDIADLGGGDGVTTIVHVTSGTTVAGAFGTYYVFDSPTNAPKNIVAPPALGSGKVIKAIDKYGDAGGDGVQGPNPISLVPNGSDIVIANQSRVYTSGGSAVWTDLLPGVWGNG